MSNISFTGQTVIVTGAGNGLGRSYALDFARRGANLVVNDLGTSVAGIGASSTAADKVVAEIQAAGGKAVANYASVSSSAGADSIIQTALDAFGRVDAVINNAGIIRASAFENVPDADLDILLDVHLKGALYVSRAAYRVMLSQGYGRIVNTSSAGGMFGDDTMACYGAAKAGILGLTNSIALAGKPHGILCNAVGPQAATRMGDNIDPETAEKFKALQVLFVNSMSTDFNVPLVVYLASRECETTHSYYTVCGGRFARAFIGLTKGWDGPLDVAPTAEDLRSHFAEIEDRSRYSVPDSVAGELMERVAALSGQAAA
ncbi:MAG: hypothetical protein JWQ90_3893 [Hydrocarboniphaga sp.]|uniref:SDR family NAD(P)-dependent oxidoreductase n=1 Tax=Hydrocarboniphaga sp. TaxID=2033016 RepID=UPI002633F8E3|nr:SDR family NAD(P)-dependent oxidoreductase [Hydrocarboniphaga sp.]MDB5971443.1 hypothetical protein [Hydrocarboniphaga sp.]